MIRFVYESGPTWRGACRSISSALSASHPGPSRHPSQPTRPTDDAIKEKVLEIVAEKTGYPKEMLDLDLDLEADLGIDTVKQAEMFAAVRAAYNIPRDENLKLRDFPTLAHVIKFARDRQPGGQAPAGSLRRAREARSAEETAASASSLRSRLPLRVRLPPVSTPPIAFRAAFLFPTCVRRLLFASQPV